MKIYHNNELLFDDIEVADSFFKRFLGLMGREALGENQGLFLKNCSSIHCFFMKIPIDAVYLSKDMKVIAVESLAPWKIGSLIPGTKHILEVHEGAALKRLKLGEQVIII